MKIRWLIVLVLFLAGCSSHTVKQPEWDPTKPVQRALTWMPITEQAGQEWGVSPRVITAIIAVESGGNPALVSKSNAVGLMQIKASTAGADVYRHLGWSGQPSTSELKDPARNISIGTAYLSIMEHGILAGIEDPQTMQYALLVSYANGAGALLRTFSSDRKKAISEINGLSPDEFWQYVAKNHPAAQAPRYLYKVSRAMEAM
ncbi:membrane-bound lytic murein transglycosylase EmtA [Enterobacter sp. R1(2018)]|uniref:membrane-bound lytic murein transglycosylase EmtA n=1 Tax=Enterobacter sp. R1(2018) TaxID=2447891 RepID=UPI000EB0951A|nr:membrane-bound lytic murein transglycosylase EmtA [Enterobacter sp. R1(2018)]RKQ38161.1 membrane-bound lytic murein transglycosylase EmtA [Enterobacter sp. R1(2018)]